MPDCCQPGMDFLAPLMLRNLDFKSLSNPSSSINKTTDDEDSKILKNGTIITMAGGEFSPTDALVVKQGTISYVGSADEAERIAGPSAKTVDLGGRCLLPGSIEPHLHLVLSALANEVFIPMSPLIVTSTDSAKAEIAKAAKTSKRDAWVVGFVHDPSRISGHLELTRDILDDETVSLGHPAYIFNLSGHIAYVNSEAFKRANIDDSIEDPNFQKKDGKLTGVLFELAVNTVAYSISQPSAEEIVSYGQNTLESQSDIDIVTAVTTQQSTVPIRYFGAFAIYTVTADPNLAKTSPVIVGKAEISTIKFWADGSTQGFTAAVTEPYRNTPEGMDPRGILNYSAKDLQDLMGTWLNKGFRLAVHANGDAAVDRTLDSYEAIFKASPDHAPKVTKVLHRIEHLTVVRPEQIERAQALGISVSQTIKHVHYWGPTFLDYVLGPKRAAFIGPLNSDNKAGLIFFLHSDSPVTDVEPLLYLRTATTRLMYPTTDVLGPDERVDLVTALRGVTTNPAMQLGIADKAGSLEVGKAADMVVLDEDLRSIDAARLDKLIVKQTWIEGRCVYDKSADAAHERVTPEL